MIEPVDGDCKGTKPRISNGDVMVSALQERAVDHPLLVLGYHCYFGTIHSSNLKDLRRCPRYFLFSERFRLRRKGLRAPALEIGTAYHALMCYLVRGELFVNAMKLVSRDTTAAFEAIKDQFSEDAYARALDVSSQQLALAGAMANWSWNFAPWPGPTGREDWEVVSTEMPFEMECPGLGAVPVRSIFDLVMRNRRTGELWVVDYKTTSRDPSKEVHKYRFAIQPKLYQLVGDHAYKDQGGITGVCYAVQKKPTIRLKKNQTWDDYLQEVTEWYNGTGRHEENKFKWRVDPPFLREWPRFRKGMDDELKGIMKSGVRACRCRPVLARFPRNEDACFAYNRECPFTPLCYADENSWAVPLAELFTVGHRDDMITYNKITGDPET